MSAFSYSQAERTNAVFKRHGIRYLFLGKSGAILLGYSDTTQDVDIFPDDNQRNRRKLVSALVELGFELTAAQKAEIGEGKAFIQLRNGPFDLDIVFAPDGIETFGDAWRNRVDVQGFPVASIDDIIRSKQAAGRLRDKESLPRLLAFRDWLRSGRPTKQ